MAKPVYTNQQVINQIDSGAYWSSGGSAASSITYGITTNNNWFPSGYGEYAGWSAFNATQAAAALAGVELWDDIIASDLNAAANPNTADIRFSNSSTGVSYAHAYYPGATNADTYSWQQSQGSVWLNPSYSSLSDPDVGEYGFMAIVHEIGHALGLDHPGEYNGGSPTYANDALYAQDTHQYTVMSYFSANNSGADWWAGNGQWYYAQTPMVHDVLVAQSIYGADATTRSGDTVYGFNANAGNAIFDFTQNANPVLTIWDGGGNDTLDLSGWNTSSTISLVAGSFSHANSMTYNIAIAFGADIENATGGGGNDTITGNELDNVLDGGAGADQLAGGGGNDTYIVDNAGDTVAENANQGIDVVNASFSYTLGTNVEQLKLTGSSHINGTGNDLANTITGNAGNNLIDGGAGADQMTGGAGNDIYVVENVGDTATENSSEGTDTVNASVSFTLSANIENLILTGSGSIDGVGNALANTITGNSGSNVLDGGGGYDILLGGAGDDVFIFDAGDNLAALDGGSGTDTLVVNGGSVPAFDLATHNLEAAEHNIVDSGSNVWSNYTDYYDASWQRFSQSGTYDDNRRWETLWDVNNAQSWSLQTYNFDAQDRKYEQLGTYDNGQTWQTLWDVNNVQSWARQLTYNDLSDLYSWNQITYRYDDQGRYYEQLGSNDNGQTWDSLWDVNNFESWSRQITYDDPSGLYSWSQKLNRYDDQGRYYEQLGTYDNGQTWHALWDVNVSESWSRQITYDDPSGLYSWSQKTLRYDDQGRYYEQTGTTDGGRVWQTQWDVNNSESWSQQISYNDISDLYSWSQKTQRYDDQGRYYEQTGTTDSGRTWQTLWDLDNNEIWAQQITYDDLSDLYSWSQQTQRYDDLNRRYEQTGSNDDGRTWQTLWDVNNSATWAQQTTLYDAQNQYSWAEQIFEYDDAGQFINTIVVDDAIV